MRLKRLEIHGFKSFADRTSLVFGGGVTAVVGPNGSGKSNVTEAIRWVLGEQSPKVLRGARMEDVIFAGTERRRPVGLAEVSLTLDNSERTLPLDFTEVTVTRRVDRSGEGEYLINGICCRLKDVYDLFADTGLGREGYFIVGQGKIDEVLSNRPEDRRGLFEEAAGVVKYKLRKKEASKKLEETQAALVRVGDILGELEVQVETLRQQAEKAARFRELSEELRRLEAAALAAEIDRSEQGLAAARERISAYSDQVSALTAELSLQEAEQENSRLKVLDLDGEIAACQSRLLALTGEGSKLRGTIDLSREKAEGSAREAARVEGEIEDLRRKQTELGAQAERLGERAAEAAAGRREILETIHRLENATAEIVKEIDRAGASSESNNNRLIDLNRRLADKQGWLGSGEKGREETQERLTRVRLEREKALAARDEADSGLTRASEEIRDLECRRELAMGGIREFSAERDRLMSQAAALDAEERRLQHEAAAMRSRVKVFEEMRREGDGFGRGVRALTLQLSRDPALGRGLCGTVAELVSVERKYELALEAAFGGGLQNIVIETDLDARRCIEWLKSAKGGRVTFLPLNTLRPNPLRAGEIKGIDSPGVVGLAMDLVKFDERYRSAMAFLLGRSVVCRDLKSGVSLGRLNDFRFRIVTLDGDQVNPGGSLTGGSPSSKSGGILSREREKNEAVAALEGLTRAAEETGRSAGETRRRLMETDDRIRRAREELHGWEVDGAGYEKDRVRYAEERARCDETVTRLEVEEAELSARLSGGARMHDQWIREIGETEREIQGLRQLIETSVAGLAELSRRKESLAVETAEMKSRLNSLEQEAGTLASEAERCRSTGAEVEDLICLKTAEASRLRSESLFHRRGMDELQAKSLAMASELESAEKDLARLTVSRRELMDATAERERRLRFLRRALSEGNENLGTARREETRCQVECETAVRRLAQDYGLELAQALEIAAGLEPGPHQAERAAELRGELEALGQVNPGAVDEFCRVMERRDFLGQQQTDLSEAANSLYQAIGVLDEKIKNRFSVSFEAIRREFAASFAHFFGGGRADLRLLGGENLLEAGIEIVAQPPGKKLQSLSLLSGGERSLTAIALLFAILKVKTAPFVVLDEIEAALDEANVERFARVLGEYGRRSQFIVVTHQKGTMAAADVLYGVTMEEQGISKIISVRLSGSADREMAG